MARRNETVRSGPRFPAVVRVAGLALLAAASPLLRSAPAWADDDAAGSVYARIRVIDGPVLLERPGATKAEAVANAPIAPADRLETGTGRARIDFADSSIAWLDAGTRVEFDALADFDSLRTAVDHLTLERGTLRIDTPAVGDGDRDFQVRTRAGSVFLVSSGSFRIEVTDEGAAVSCYTGAAEVSGEGGSVLLRSGQRCNVPIGRMPFPPKRLSLDRIDDFDRFHDDAPDAGTRSQKGGGQAGGADGLPAAIQPYAAELTRFGVWVTLPIYGLAWRPETAAAWAPYGRGYWDRCPSGWVWVSEDAWGWAPYHYGRWDHLASVGWIWIPGSVWSGAWVGFAVGPALIGWAPLNFWNHPVFHDASIAGETTISLARLDPRGWQFVPLGRFGQRPAGAPAVKGDRLPRGVDLVVTRTLPPFDPWALARAPEGPGDLVEVVRRGRVALPAAESPTGEALPFRTQERAVHRGRPAAAGANPSGGSLQADAGGAARGPRTVGRGPERSPGAGPRATNDHPAGQPGPGSHPRRAPNRPPADAAQPAPTEPKEDGSQHQR